MASVAGQFSISRLVKKYNKQSLVVFTIVIVIALSAVLLAVSGISTLVRDIKLGRSLGFKSFCPS